MNASLLNPFTVTHPTAVQTSLVSGASFARFDPTGKFVAAGRSDGSAAIWDLDTRAVIRWCEGHVKAVTSVDWSRNSRYVLTSSKDWNVIIWDLASPVDPPQRCNTIRFDAPVVSAYFHPRNSRIVLALLSTGEAYVVDSRKEHRARVELCETLGEDDDDERARSIMTTARFDPSGRHVFVGTSTGNVLVFNSRTKIMVARHRVAGAGSMKSLEFAKVGRRFATNSSDRTIRQFILPTYPSPIVGAESTILETELEPTHRFNDPISKVSWHAMSYSPDGEWLAGGSADPATHKIYIWDISNDGQFATALDGGREPLIDIHWHPQASRLASTTNQGSVLIWHCPSPERWGAFAGGFEEADENVMYEEGEAEFDIENEVELAMRKKLQEDEAVDILGGVENVVDHKMNGVAGDPGDEDLEWADDEPDDDWQEWRLKDTIIREFSDMSPTFFPLFILDRVKVGRHY